LSQTKPQGSITYLDRSKIKVAPAADRPKVTENDQLSGYQPLPVVIPLKENT
jgi:hypothetical protein